MSDNTNAPIPPGMSTGAVPRDYAACPPGYLAFAPVVPDEEILDRSNWKAAFDEKVARGIGLLEHRKANYDYLKSLNQNGLGLCWAFSTTKACMYLRYLMGEPNIVLSAWWLAGVINNWQDRGGWGAASLGKAVQDGIPAMDLCPTYNRKYDTPECRQNAAYHKVTEWYDGLNNPDRNQDILVSFLLRGRPCVVDLNVMGHSMCAIDVQSIDPLVVIYDNSWGTSGDPDGLYYGKGAYARPDGLVIPRVSTPSTI